MKCALSSVGRATPLHGEGREFESLRAHNDSQGSMFCFRAKHHCDARRDENGGACESSETSREPVPRPRLTGQPRVAGESLRAHI